MDAHTHHPTALPEGTEELIAFLAFTVKHNHSHTAELESLAQALQAADRTAAAQISAAADAYREGNARLEEALRLLQEQERMPE